MTHSKVDQALKIAIGALLAALAFVIVYTMKDHVTEVGDKAPAFTVTTDRGQVVSTKDFGGKVLVLNFWASWCAPCVQEAPSLNEFQKMLASSGVVVLGISIDQNASTVRAVSEELNVAFPDRARSARKTSTTATGPISFPRATSSIAMARWFGNSRDYRSATAR